MGWWEQPYKGGPMVPVPGFPRELHPPDHPDGPAVDGPDVIAYKRTVWRAGRWQGPASRFDDSYSNGFAHGCGPNVVDTGVAGVQRQQNRDDTGVIDQPFFNTLRSMLVPPDRPHAGEPCMDALAANLIAEAYTLFHSAPQPPATVRERALAGATRWIGTTEQPAGSNHTTFGEWYGVDQQPWCAIFVTYCFEVEAGGSPSFERGSRYAYVPYIVGDAGAMRNGLTITTTPAPGDLACYDWDRDGTFDHVGLFEAGSPSSFTAIEGNTSTTSNSNGGAVMRRDRSTAQASIVFVRVAEP